MNPEDFHYGLVGKPAYFIDTTYGKVNHFVIDEVKISKKSIIFNAGWHQVPIEEVFLTETQALLNEKQSEVKQQKIEIRRQSMLLKKLRREEKALREQVLIEQLAGIDE